MGKGSPTYSTVQITPDVTLAEVPPPDSIAIALWAAPSGSIATINKGIQVAAESRWITPTNPLWGKLQKLVQELEAGRNLTTAAQSAGVSQRLVERLLELGSQSQKSRVRQSSPETSTAIINRMWTLFSLLSFAFWSVLERFVSKSMFTTTQRVTLLHKLQILVTKILLKDVKKNYQKPKKQTIFPNIFQSPQSQS